MLTCNFANPFLSFSYLLPSLPYLTWETALPAANCNFLLLRASITPAGVLIASQHSVSAVKHLYINLRLCYYSQLFTLLAAVKLLVSQVGATILVFLGFSLSEQFLSGLFSASLKQWKMFRVAKSSSESSFRYVRSWKLGSKKVKAEIQCCCSNNSDKQPLSDGFQKAVSKKIKNKL